MCSTESVQLEDYINKLPLKKENYKELAVLNSLQYVLEKLHTMDWWIEEGAERTEISYTWMATNYVIPSTRQLCVDKKLLFRDRILEEDEAAESIELPTAAT